MEDKLSVHPCSPKSALIQGQELSGPYASSCPCCKMEDVCSIFGDCKDDPQLMMVLTEIVTTEKKYINDLELLIKGYLVPLKESRVISDADLVALYSNIEEIWDLHTTMLGRLYTLASDKKPDQSLSHSVGDLFMQKIEDLKVYGNYISEVPVHLAKDSWFCSFLDRLRKTTGSKLHIDDYMIKPVQRICKYPLFFKELCKLTPEKSVDRSFLEEVIQALENIVQYVNDMRFQRDAANKLMEKEDMIVGLPAPLALPGRVLVKEGLLQKMSPREGNFRQDRYCLLCRGPNGEDVFIYTKLQKKIKKYEFRGQIPLNDAILKDISSSNGFQLAPRDNPKTFTFFCKNVADKRLWMKEIECILLKRPLSAVIGSDDVNATQSPKESVEISERSGTISGVPPKWPHFHFAPTRSVSSADFFSSHTTDSESSKSQARKPAAIEGAGKSVKDIGSDENSDESGSEGNKTPQQSYKHPQGVPLYMSGDADNEELQGEAIDTSSGDEQDDKNIKADYESDNDGSLKSLKSFGEDEVKKMSLEVLQNTVVSLQSRLGEEHNLRVRAERELSITKLKLSHILQTKQDGDSAVDKDMPSSPPQTSATSSDFVSSWINFQTVLEKSENDQWVKEGFLTKMGEHRTNWKERWFRLTLGSLSYFKTKKEKRPLGVIILKNAIVTRSHKKPFCISINTQGRDWLVCVDNDSDFFAWMAAIKSCVVKTN